MAVGGGADGEGGIDEVERRIDALYAADLAREAPRVMHVAAAWQGRRGELVNIAADPAAPRSATDAFVLWLARARADAIVTTGRILRAEPQLVYDFAAPEAEGLLAWRRQILGKSAPPICAVLSSGRELDLAHPLLCDPSGALVFTDRAAAAALAARGAGVELVADPAPDLHALLRALRTRLDRPGRPGTILVEAGPSTASALYQGAGAEIDELMLSVCLAARIPESARAGPFITPATIAASGLACVSESAREEESGPWLFRRLLRRHG